MEGDQFVRASKNRIIKALLALEHGLRHHSSARAALANLYNARITLGGRIRSAAVIDLIRAVPEIRLVDFLPENGDLTAFELVCLCSLIRVRHPKFVLELGTFTGNATLQIAANLDANAQISTLDFPLGSTSVTGNDTHDAALIDANVRDHRSLFLSMRVIAMRASGVILKRAWAYWPPMVLSSGTTTHRIGRTFLTTSMNWRCNFHSSNLQAPIW